MKKYEVLAQIVVFGIKDGNEKKEYTLKKGDTIDLPETENAVKAMLVRGQIKELETKEKSGKNK